MRIGAVLRKWRAASERNLREVSDEIGIHYSTLARIEKGVMPPADALIKIVLWLVKPEEEANGVDPLTREGIASALSIDSLTDTDGKGD